MRLLILALLGVSSLLAQKTADLWQVAPNGVIKPKAGRSVALGTSLPAGAPTGSVGATCFYNPQSGLDVRCFGAKGDVKILDDGAISASSNIFTSATAGFTTADVGKNISVSGAGVANATLYTTISSITSSTSVHLVANASSTVSGVTFMFGANDTTAIANAMAAACAANGSVFIPTGVYFTDPINTFCDAPAPIDATSNSIAVSGVSSRASVLVSRTGGHILEATGMVALNGLTIDRLGFRGNGGTGHCIYIHDNTGSPYDLRFTNLRVQSCGGKGIYVAKEFSSYYANIDIGNTGDNAFEVDGGSAETVVNVYVHDVATNKVGFRFHGGRPVLIGCNGLDNHISATGTIWGLFGDSITHGDGRNNYSYPTFINTNIEDFGSVGVQFVGFSYGNFFSSTLVAPATGTVKGLLYENTSYTHGAIFDGNSSISTKGAAWANSYAVHTNGGGPPFIPGGVDGLPQTKYYDDTGAATFDFGALMGVTLPVNEQFVKVLSGGQLTSTNQLLVDGSGNIVVRNKLLVNGGWAQIKVSSTNPGCAGSADYGKVWFDSTVTTDTVFKVCMAVSGTPTWVQVKP